MAIEELKRHKLPGIDQIPTELIKVWGRTIRSEIHKLLIMFGIRGNCLRRRKSRSFYLYIRRVIKEIVVIIDAIHPVPTSPTHFLKIHLNIILPSTSGSPHWSLSIREFCQLRTRFYLTYYSQGYLNMQNKYLGIIAVNFDATGQLLIICSALVKYWRKNEAVHQLFISFKKVYDWVRREVLHNSFIGFDILMQLVKPIKLCLSKIYSRVRASKGLSDMFPIKNCLK